MSFINACGGIKLKNTQEKTVNAVTTQQNIIPDNGYDALSKVLVENVPVQNKTVIANGVVTPDDGYMGLGSVTAKVSVSYKSTRIVLSNVSKSQADSKAYMLSFSIPITSFNNEHNTLPSKFFICADDPDDNRDTRGVYMLVLSKELDDTYSGSIIVGTNGYSSYRPLYQEIASCSCLTINGENYEFTMELKIQSGSLSDGTIYYQYPIVRNGDAFDVTFIWN